MVSISFVWPPWAKRNVITAMFRLISPGPIIKKKYNNSPHLFWEESNIKFPLGVLYMGENDKYKTLEVVFNNNILTINKIKTFLNKHKIKVKLIELK